jgi:hypothetical protein
MEADWALIGEIGELGGETGTCGKEDSDGIGVDNLLVDHAPFELKQIIIYNSSLRIKSYTLEGPKEMVGRRPATCSFCKAIFFSFWKPLITKYSIKYFWNTLDDLGLSGFYISFAVAFFSPILDKFSSNST